MADIVMHTSIPTPGSVVSVPVAVEYGKAVGGLFVGTPEDASCPTWDALDDKSPIAEGQRAHLFVAPSWHIETSQIMDFYFIGDWQLDILNTIRSIKSNNLTLTNFAAKLGNAYCLDYDNPYTRGCAVGLTDSLAGSSLANRFKFTRIGLSSGRVDGNTYSNSTKGTWYYGLTSTAHSVTDWKQDGFVESNMFQGIHKDTSTGDGVNISVNNLKSALDPADVNSHTVEVYRGLFFADDPVNAGETAAGDILVIVDWDDEMEYQCFNGFNDQGFPNALQTVIGPKAFFAIAWKDVSGDMTQRLSISMDPDYEYSRMIDVYAPAPALEFDFIQYGGGGGGGGNKGHGGRAVSSSIPMRITSRGDVDYRHYLDLYDETNYNERNMFLTNFVGRIPYKLVDYDSSEAGGTGVIRVATELQFTHFVGASFSDANVPRVYEVISHKSMGGSPETLLCTFRVCHLKDYFQHFGVTAENEFLVQRSTYSGLYNPWMKDSRIFSETTVEEGFDYGSGGFNFGLNKCLITLTSGEALIWDINAPAPGYSETEPHNPNYDHTWFYQVNGLNGLINLCEDVDSDPKSTLREASMINAILSKISNVYLVSSQMVSNWGSSGSVNFQCNLSYSTDPSDPEGSLYTDMAFIELRGNLITNPEVPKHYLTGFLGGAHFDDWVDMESNYILQIPWYGVVELSGVEMKRILDRGQGTIGVDYRISALDGTITVAMGGTGGLVPREWKRLPKLPIPQSSRTLSYRQTTEQINSEAAIRQKQTDVTTWMSIGGGVVGGAAALLMGNPIAAAAAVGGGVAAAVGANISNDLRDRSAAIGSKIAASNITFNSTSCDGFEMLTIQKMWLTKVRKAEIINVYPTIGYPCAALWRSVGAVNGYKYWVAILGNIKGTNAYAQAVRGEIERDGIIYNYS